MKVIIAGTRKGCRYSIVKHAVELFEKEHGKITEVVHGGCEGVDRLADLYASINSLPRKIFPFAKYIGAFGGPARNQAMVDYADGLVVVMYDESLGSADVLKRARDANLPVASVILVSYDEFVPF